MVLKTRKANKIFIKKKMTRIENTTEMLTITFFGK
jgi:hypothetical protein